MRKRTYIPKSGRKIYFYTMDKKIGIDQSNKGIPKSWSGNLNDRYFLEYLVSATRSKFYCCLFSKRKKEKDKVFFYNSQLKYIYNERDW